MTCYDCDKRHVGCRKDCPVWAAHEERIAEIRKNRAKDTAVAVYQMEQIAKTRKRLREKKSMRRRKRK